MSPRAAPDATPEEIEVASSLLVLAASSSRSATKRGSEGTSAHPKFPKSGVHASPSSERGDDESSNVAAPRAARAPGDADVTSNAALVVTYNAPAASDNVPYNARNAPSSAFPARLKAPPRPPGPHNGQGRPAAMDDEVLWCAAVKRVMMQMQPARTPLGIVEALELVNDTAHYPWKKKILFGSTMRKAIHMVCGVRTWSMIGAINDPDAAKEIIDASVIAAAKFALLL
jgi:hypothetical protein